MIYVQATQASLDNEDAVRQLLVALPHPRVVRTLLRRKFFGRSWRQGESCDYWLASNGATVISLRVCGVSSAQAYVIRLRYDELTARNPLIELSRDLLCELVRGVTGECRCSVEPNIAIK